MARLELRLKDPTFDVLTSATTHHPSKSVGVEGGGVGGGGGRGLGQPLVRQLNPSLTHGFFQSTSTWAKITKARNIHIILGALVLATSNNRSILFKQTIDMSKSLCAKIFL